MTTINSNPIGIFDSGIGGLSITKYIKQQLPYEKLIYVADTLHAPYGDKSTQSIINRVDVIVDKLLEQEIKTLVIACNTATVNTITLLRKRIDTPIIGVEPAIKPASIYTKSNKVGVLVTQSTANNQHFLTLINKYSKDIDVTIQPCPGLVELIEQGHMNSAQCDELLKCYLLPLIEKNVDTIVLGCTHYPFLLDKIRIFCGNSIKIIHTAMPVTNELKRQLQKNKLGTTSIKFSTIEFFSSKPSILLNNLSMDLMNQKVSFKLF